MSSNVRMENDDRENIHDIPMQPSVNSSKLLIKFAIEQQWQIKEVTGQLSLRVWNKKTVLQWTGRRTDSSWDVAMIHLQLEMYEFSNWSLLHSRNGDTFSW